MVRVHIGHMEMFFLTVDEAAGTELFYQKAPPRSGSAPAPRRSAPHVCASQVIRCLICLMTLTLTDGPRSRLIAAVHLHVRDRKLVFMIPCVM